MNSDDVVEVAREAVRELTRPRSGAEAVTNPGAEAAEVVVFIDARDIDMAIACSDAWLRDLGGRRPMMWRGALASFRSADGVRGVALRVQDAATLLERSHVPRASRLISDLRSRATNADWMRDGVINDDGCFALVRDVGRDSALELVKRESV